MPISTARTWPAPQWDLSNYTNLRQEPPDHAIGRSRGGLTTKIHALVDGQGRPLVLLTGPGQGGDSPMFLPLIGQLKVGLRRLSATNSLITLLCEGAGCVL